MWADTENFPGNFHFSIFFLPWSKEILSRWKFFSKVETLKVQVQAGGIWRRR
jgi:hypothetical protein